MEKYYSKATLDDVFIKMISFFNTRTAIIFEDKNISYNDLKLEVFNYAIKLKRLGVKKGDKVALLLPNCYEYICLYFAIFLAGATAVPINTRSVKIELFNILQDSEADVLIFENIISNLNYLDIINEIKSDLPKLKTCILRGNVTDDRFISLNDFKQYTEDLESEIKRFVLPDTAEDDVALLAYTSGTTSTPKGVMITHGGLVNSSYYAGIEWNITFDTVSEDFVALSVAPLYGAQGFLAVLCDMVCGITMKWLSTFNPNEIIKAISVGKINALHTQPTMWSLLLSSQLLNFCNFDKLDLTLVSGSLCSYNLAKRIEERTNTILLNGYGLIEGTGIALITRREDSEDIRLHTVGRPIPGVEVKIVDSDRKDVPKGEVGEIALRGNLMKGYYNNEEKTRQVIDEEGWLYTGDMGRFYKGTENIEIVGRCKEMIIRGGYNVFPIDIEEQLLNHPSIQDVAVVGKDDDILSESIVAFIIPTPGCKLTKIDVIKYAKTCLASHKIPDHIYFLKQFPIILNGKVQKNVLHDWAKNGIPEDEIFNF